MLDRSYENKQLQHNIEVWECSSVIDAYFCGYVLRTLLNKTIIEDLGDEYFAILADESRDISHKEQMALAIIYVDKRGFVVERVIGLSHVT
jgi:hypothetical protein